MPVFRNLNTGSIFYRHNEPHKKPLSAGRPAGISRDNSSAEGQQEKNRSVSERPP